MKEVDLNEDSDAHFEDSDSRSISEDGEEDGDEESAGEFFDVLDVFDGRADVEDEDDSPPKLDKKLKDVQTKVTVVEDEGEWGGTGEVSVGMSEDEEEAEGDDEDEDSADDEDEDDELRISASDSEDLSPEALADLETFLSNLDPATSHKRKPDDVTQLVTTKRQRLADRTEAGEESEFGVRGIRPCRCCTTHVLTSVQARVLSRWMTFWRHSRLPPPLSLPSRDQRNLSHHLARKRKRCLHHYLSEHKNV